MIKSVAFLNFRTDTKKDAKKLKSDNFTTSNKEKSKVIAIIFSLNVLLSIPVTICG